jgi:hypothetical protein
MHHEITKPKYGFSYLNQIVERSLSDQEIEDDILQIRQLLSPRPFIIVSHICTYNYGTQYELVQLLEKICKRHDIPFFNPNVILQSYTPAQLFTYEKGITHYSDLGHQVIGKEYKRIIDSVYHP